MQPTEFPHTTYILIPEEQKTTQITSEISHAWQGKEVKYSKSNPGSCTPKQQLIIIGILGTLGLSLIVVGTVTYYYSSAFKAKLIGGIVAGVGGGLCLYSVCGYFSKNSEKDYTYTYQYPLFYGNDSRLTFQFRPNH